MSRLPAGGPPGRLRPTRFEEIIGSSPALQEVFRIARRVAPTRANVLLMGETGTGKELLARAIHYASRRADGPFVRVNCGALSEGLLESELFGHVKGAFTGAIENRAGRFEAAHTGTIFLDEISTTSPLLQVKLLRVLQEGEFERVGDSTTISVDVRVLAATNKNLVEEVRAGRFREDLYYRLNVVPIVVPPLRERREDIPLLVTHFLEQYSLENGRDVPRLRPEAMDRLCQYAWPGNVRELQNCIERAVVLSTTGEVTMDLLPAAVRAAAGPAEPAAAPGAIDALVDRLVRDLLAAEPAGAAGLYERIVSRIERALLRRVLDECGQVQIKAAQRLGINRNTLHRKIQELGLEPPA